MALKEITNGQFPNLPKLAITGLLNDFQYAWLQRLDIPYKFEMLDFARGICNGENRAVFETTQCKSIKDIRKQFSNYIEKMYKNDDRVILSVVFDGKQINAEWFKLEEYLDSNKKLKQT